MHSFKMNMLVTVVSCWILLPLVLCDTLHYQPSRLGTNCNSSDHICHPDQTCCMLKDGHQACCNLQKATCCDDFLHCCPQDYTCDNVKGVCVRGMKTLPYLNTKIPNIQTKQEKSKHDPISNVQSASRRMFGALKQRVNLIKQEVTSYGLMCPDKKTECPDGNTCCRMDDDQWGCCPFRNAVCCPGGNICCPPGYECNCDKKMCFNETRPYSIPMVKKHSATRLDGDPRTQYMPASVSCGDGSVCRPGSTCCERQDGSYSCCPVDGICCGDRKHCCPSGSTCDPISRSCQSEGLLFDWLYHARDSAKKSHSIMCPDHHSMCADNCTCCLRTDMSWGCCPLPHAVCCSDHIHCCPHNWTCDLVHMTCTSHWKTHPWSPLKSPAGRVTKPH